MTCNKYTFLRPRELAVKNEDEAITEEEEEEEEEEAFQ